MARTGIQFHCDILHAHLSIQVGKLFHAFPILSHRVFVPGQDQIRNDSWHIAHHFCLLGPTDLMEEIAVSTDSKNKITARIIQKAVHIPLISGKPVIVRAHRLEFPVIVSDRKLIEQTAPVMLSLPFSK